MGKVKWRTMIAFTLFQAVYCGAVYGITWIPVSLSPSFLMRFEGTAHYPT